jgi:hypothetical protein
MLSKAEKESSLRQYQALATELTKIGYIRRGSLLKRFTVCGSPTCACRDNPPILHGPYYQWTRKVEGKTVTVRLTAEKAVLLASWIANGRRFNRIVSQMEKLSMRVTEHLLAELPSRVRKLPRTRRGGAKKR